MIMKDFKQAGDDDYYNNDESLYPSPSLIQPVAILSPNQVYDKL